MNENIAVAQINKAVNGIELSFDKKPAYEVLKDLKEHGFRWHNKKQIWYARNSAANVRAVEKYVDLNASDVSFGITPEGTVDVRALRAQRLRANEIVPEAVARNSSVIDSVVPSVDSGDKAIADGGNREGITSAPSLSDPIKSWYVEKYPSDADIIENSPGTTFRDLLAGLNEGKDAYEVIFGSPMGGDTLSRERIFTELSRIVGCDYDDIYRQWLDRTPGGLARFIESEGIDKPLEEQYSLGFSHLGNGITVWNRLAEEHGDYKTVAHISPERIVTYYDKKMPEAVKQKIRDFAEKADPTVSATQEARVFRNPPKVNEKVPEQGKEPEREKVPCLADFYSSVGRGDILRDSTVGGSLWSPMSGRGYYADLNACIYCNREAAYVVELDNAMKRGKECKRYTIYAQGQDIHLYLVNECNVRTPKDLYDLVRSGKELPGPATLTVGEEKGVDVFSPFVAAKPLKELPEKWKKGDLVKAIMSGQVFSGVLDQRLTDDYAYDAAMNFGTGRQIDLPGQAYDLVEGCRDCYIRTDGVDENGIASIHFSYAGEMKTFLFDLHCDLAKSIERQKAAAQALKEHNAELRASVIPVKESDIDPNKVYIVDKVVEDSNTGKLGIESDVVQGFAFQDRLGLDEVTGIREAVLVPNKLYQVANFFDRREYAEEDARIIDTGNWGQVCSGKAIEELTREGVYLYLKTPDYENPRSFEAVKRACMEFISGNSRFLFGNEVDYSKSLQKLEAEEARLNQDKSAKREFSSLADIIGFAEIKKEFEKNQRNFQEPVRSYDDRDIR